MNKSSLERASLSSQEHHFLLQKTLQKDFLIPTNPQNWKVKHSTIIMLYKK